jgi:2-amino-4-hydroxy-6-hydroxymethyldihydropteridine diphosphokinase
MPTCLIGLGANLGNRRETLDRAVELLGQQSGVRLLRVSRWQETRPAGPPVGGAEQPLYLNGAATIETSLAPSALLAVLQAIEHDLGRRRRQRWEARPVDLDLLLYDDRVERSDSLVVPHPRMAWRRFVLEPASQIAPSMTHPVIGWTIARLLEHLNSSPRYVAVTGAASPENTRFVRCVARACPVDLLLDAPRRAANPSGPRPAVALECLRRRARALAVGNPRWPQPPRYTVSDFWFDETRALALSRIAECEPSRVFRLWRRLKPRVASPRLIVWLDVPAPTGLRRDFQRQLHRRDVGPVLRIEDPQSPEALDEVVAAIQAMG